MFTGYSCKPDRDPFCITFTNEMVNPILCTVPCLYCVLITQVWPGAGYSKLDMDMINMFAHKEIGTVPWTWSTLRPGDCIFVPSGKHAGNHHCYIIHLYIGAGNILDVWDFLFAQSVEDLLKFNICIYSVYI